MHEVQEYASLKALDRESLFLGVPLLPAVGLLGIGVLLFLFGGRFGMSGFLLGFLVMPVFLFLRQICEHDDKAIRITLLEVRYRLKRAGFLEYGHTLTYLPERYFHHDELVLQAFGQNSRH